MVARMSPWKRWKRWDRQRHDPTLCFPEGKSPLPVPMVCLNGMGPSLRYPGNPDPDPDRPWTVPFTAWSSSARTDRSNRATEQPSSPSCSESEFGKFWSWEINRQDEADEAGGCYVSIRFVFSDAHVVCVDLGRGHHDVKYQVGIETMRCSLPTSAPGSTPFGGGPITRRAILLHTIGNNGTAEWVLESPRFLFAAFLTVSYHF